jgi:NAD kinase
MGKMFFEVTAPKIAKNLERIANSLEKSGAEDNKSDEKKYELVIWLEGDGYIYYRTNKDDVAEAFQEFCEIVNVDHALIRATELRIV